MRRSTSVSTGRFFHSSYVILDKDFTPFPGLELFLVRAFFRGRLAPQKMFRPSQASTVTSLPLSCSESLAGLVSRWRCCVVVAPLPFPPFKRSGLEFRRTAVASRNARGFRTWAAASSAVWSAILAFFRIWAGVCISASPALDLSFAFCAFWTVTCCDLRTSAVSTRLSLCRLSKRFSSLSSLCFQSWGVESSLGAASL